MSDFLMKLYEEEMEKVSQADLAAFMDSLSVEELAAIAGLEKTAAKMSLQRRESLPSKAFAVPATKAKKLGVSGEIKGEAKGKYPIPDIKHARNALARVSQKGTPGEKAAVRSKVYSRFPGLKEGFQERHGGASPTSKANIRKTEQGGIGKSASVLFMGKLAVAGPTEGEMPTGEGYETTDKSKKKGQHEPAADVQASEEKKAAAFWAKIAACKRAQGPGEEPTGEETSGNGGMEKAEDFTTPEAQAKAKVMSRALKTTKGAPTNVRKAAVSVAAKEMRKVGASPFSGDLRKEAKEKKEPKGPSYKRMMGAGAGFGGLLGTATGWGASVPQLMGGGRLKSRLARAAILTGAGALGGAAGGAGGGALGTYLGRKRLKKLQEQKSKK